MKPDKAINNNGPLFLINFMVPRYPFEFPAVFTPSAFRKPTINKAHKTNDNPFKSNAPSKPIIFFAKATLLLAESKPYKAEMQKLCFD